MFGDPSFEVSNQDVAGRSKDGEGLFCCIECTIGPTKGDQSVGEKAEGVAFTNAVTCLAVERDSLLEDFGSSGRFAKG